MSPANKRLRERAKVKLLASRIAVPSDRMRQGRSKGCQSVEKPRRTTSALTSARKNMITPASSMSIPVP